MKIDHLFEAKFSMTAPDFMRALLLLNIFSMAFLAVFYLRQRSLSWLAFLGWGLLAVLVPILGPFMVIASHPGRFPANRRARYRPLRPR
jgi:hypothetical protein